MQATAQLPLPSELNIDPLIQAEPYEIQRLLHRSILSICHLRSQSRSSEVGEYTVYIINA